ncbi:hypothetical protein N665_0098s0006, partial [Sinapis alba]
WPYLNRWSSNLLHDASAPAALELVPPHPPTGPMVIAESGASLTKNVDNESQLDDIKKVAPLGDSGAPPTALAAPPSVTHDQEPSLVAAVHDPSSVAAIHNSSLVTTVNDSLVVVVDDVTVDEAPPLASSDLNGEDNKNDLNEDEDTAQKDTFVQSLDAWSKPLHFTPPLPRLGISEAVNCQIDSLWLTIGEAIVNGPKTKKGQMLVPEQAKPQLPVKTIPPPALKGDGSLRFPWAARMNQSSRNLFRATEPTYRLDSTPQEIIPTKAYSMLMICLLFVAPWNPVNSFKTPEISTLPVWINRKNIPDSCFSRLGISHITSGLGEPMLTHKPRLDPTNIGEAKILVEVELDKPFPKFVALDDKQGNIYLVEVEYFWIPSACERCGALGHKDKRCLLPPQPQNSAPITKEPQVTNEEVPMVDIVKLLQNSSTCRADHLEPNLRSPITQQTHQTTKNSLVILPLKDAFASPGEVHLNPCSQIDNTYFC